MIKFIKNLEIQVGQIANLVFECNAGTFLSNTIPNPTEQVNTIILRSEKEVGWQQEQAMAKTTKGNQGEARA